jgi:hypothetical protein
METTQSILSIANAMIFMWTREVQQVLPVILNCTYEEKEALCLLSTFCVPNILWDDLHIYIRSRHVFSG